MVNFNEKISRTSVLLDKRNNIGPHHLAIGKTRKLFQYDGIIHAFWSNGYEIMHARLASNSLAVLEISPLNLPVAWGGGAFCIDSDTSGKVMLVFLHRNQHELCLCVGQLEGYFISWGRWRPLLFSNGRQAAPWVEIGLNGTGWASVIDSNFDFRLASILSDETVIVSDLFSPEEDRWHHSCVQVLPISEINSVAIGFRGEFPTKTELVFKTVTLDGKVGPSKRLAPCNVNDKLTFHFQAVGDPIRGTAHIVYLDEGLHVSHAQHIAGEWIVTSSILPFACFAPQICINDCGTVVLIAADYEGGIWSSVWTKESGWADPQCIRNVPAPNISSLFGQTGYGTGGMICSARSDDGRVPFLVSTIEDDRMGNAKLELVVLGGGDGLYFSNAKQLNIRICGNTVQAEIYLEYLCSCDVQVAGRSWVVTIPSESGQALKLILEVGDGGVIGYALWMERSGQTHREIIPSVVTVQLHDAFSVPSLGALLSISAIICSDPTKLLPKLAWVESYEAVVSPAGGNKSLLVDIGPFDPETNAKLAFQPERIATTFRRII